MYVCTAKEAVNIHIWNFEMRFGMMGYGGVRSGKMRYGMVGYFLKNVV